MAENDNELAGSMSAKDVSGSMRKATFNNLEDGSKPGAPINEIDLKRSKYKLGRKLFVYQF